MSRNNFSSKKLGKRAGSDPDDIQDRLAEDVIIQKTHGGHEHGSDWDNWLKADRILNSNSNKRKRVRAKPSEF